MPPPPAACIYTTEAGRQGGLTDTIALPFCGFQIKAKRPTNTKCCKNPVSIGDHLRNRRLALKLDQARVANLLGTGADTVYLWENNRVKPTFPFFPKIIEFLGFCPIDPEDSPGRRLTWARQCNGLSQSQLALSTGMDASTLGELEKGRWLRREQFLKRVREFLEKGV